MPGASDKSGALLRSCDKFLESGKKGLVNGAGDDNVYKTEIERLQKIIGKQAIQIEILKKNGRFAGDKMSVVDSLKQAGYGVVDACEASDWTEQLLCGQAGL